jgi:hypothetical protein
MTQKEKILISILLDLASDEFATHGCNDLDDAFWAGWTKEERQELMKDFHKYNGDPENYDPEFLHVGDSSLMGYFSKKLLRE